MFERVVGAAIRLGLAVVCTGTFVQSTRALGPSLDEVLGYRREAGRARIDVFPHATADGSGGIHSWLHVSPSVLSWMAIIGGGALIASGVASDSDQYRKGAVITGGVLVPLGLWRVLTKRQETPSLVADSTVRDYESVVRNLYASRRDDRAAMLDLIRQYPELHRKLVFTMTALRDPGSETAEDSAFIDWYLSFEQKR